MASNDTCPVCRTAEIVCGKWTLLVIRDLAEGRSRFCELERSLQGISPRTLSLRLRALEEEGIVERQTFPEVPPRVEYALTEKGRALVPLIEDMRAYGLAWLGGEEPDDDRQSRRAGRRRAGDRRRLTRQAMRIAVAADELTGVAEALPDELRTPRPRADPARAYRRATSGRTGLGRASRRPATSPRAAPSRRSSRAGPAPARRSRRTRWPGSGRRLCADAPTADGARRWNDANVLALSLRLTSHASLEEILDAWFAGQPSHGRRRRRERRPPGRDRDGR